MDRCDYQPGRKSSPSAFQVKQIRNRWVVFGPYGQFARSVSSRGEAEAEALRGQEHYRRGERDAMGAVGDLGAAGPEGDDPRLSPMAFQVAHFGDAAGGYGVFNERGGIDKTFSKRAEADRHAADRRAAYQASRNPAPGGGGASSAAVPTPASVRAAAFSGLAGVQFRRPPMPSASAQAQAIGSAASSSARGSATTDPGGIAGAFERAFNASIDKAIGGAEKIVTSSLDAFRQGYAGVKSAAGNPIGAASAVNSAASRAAMGASVVAAFAAARAQGFGSGVAGSVGGAFSQAFAAGGPRKKASRRPAGRTSGVSSAAAAAVARARRSVSSNAYRSARRQGASQASARGAARGASRAIGYAAIAAKANEFKLATLALTSIPKLLHDAAEGQLGQNRRLAPYSAGINMGFAKLELGDQFRDLRLAKSAEGTASTLARQVNGIRDSMSGLDQLALGVGNRLGIAAAALVAPGFREIGLLAGQAGGALNKADPGGTAIEDVINKFHEKTAFLAGGIMGMFANGPIPDPKAAMLGAKEAEKEARRAALAEKQAAMRMETDAWTFSMQNAMNLPAIRPARPLVR